MTIPEQDIVSVELSEFPDDCSQNTVSVELSEMLVDQIENLLDYILTWNWKEESEVKPASRWEAEQIAAEFIRIRCRNLPYQVYQEDKKLILGLLVKLREHSTI